jgi:hypothetical protein
LVRAFRVRLGSAREAVANFGDALEIAAALFGLPSILQASPFAFSARDAGDQRLFLFSSGL